jgi:hypothetical protein
MDTGHLDKQGYVETFDKIDPEVSIGSYGIAAAALFVDEYEVFPSGEKAYKEDMPSPEVLEWARKLMKKFPSYDKKLREEYIKSATEGGCLFVRGTLVATGVPEAWREKMAVRNG